MFTTEGWTSKSQMKKVAGTKLQLACTLERGAVRV